jgi:NADPH-dependent ferric siderophore reductase
MNSPRPSRPQRVLTVETTEQVTPHVVRVWLTDSSEGDTNLFEFPDNGLTDSYVKLVFVDPALGLKPPYDLDGLRETLPKEQLPVTRTYTVRSVDRDARRLSIDFVTHGDTGLAAPWAVAARPGDRLSFHGPGGGYAPDAEVPWHAFVGDLSALPAISVALETLPATATGVALIEIHDEADAIEVAAPAGVEVRWLINPDSEDIDFLAGAVDAIEWPADAAEPGRVQVFAHGERESIKSIRKVLRERAIPRESLSISGYWARGRTEDVFQAEKREPIGQID